MLNIRHIYLILKQFLDGFSLSNNGRIPKPEVAFFFLIPIVISCLVVLNYTVERGTYSTLLVGISIYMGFLVSMLVPFLNFIEREEETVPDEKKKDKKEQKEARIKQYKIMYTQVAFAILVSIFLVVCLIVASSFNFLINEFNFELMNISFSLGTLFYKSSEICSFFFLILNIFTLIKILVSANVIIYPKLK